MTADERSPLAGGGTAPGCDRLLGGRVVLAQPARGFRAGLDAVLLAAAVPARAGESVLEIGTGTGAVALCLAARVEGVAVTGLELVQALALIARNNVAANGLDRRLRIVEGDLFELPEALRGSRFDHVATNPPFHPPGPEGAAGSGLAKIDRAGPEAWLGACLARLRPGGRLTLIHRADRLPELLAALAGAAGAIEIVPLWPKPGVPAKRVVLRARKGARDPALLSPGLVLHQPDGRFTAAAEAILRHGAALDDVLPAS